MWYRAFLYIYTFYTFLYFYESVMQNDMKFKWYKRHQALRTGFIYKHCDNNMQK